MRGEIQADSASHEDGCIETTHTTASTSGGGIYRGTINGIPIYSWSSSFVVTIPEWMLDALTPPKR